VTPDPALRVLLVAAAALCGLGLMSFGSLLLDGSWPMPRDGGQAMLDFAPLYAAARLALSGRAAEAYDWSVLQEEMAAFGAATAGGWLNPPGFFLVVLPFGLLPFAGALPVWIGLTGLLHARAIHCILPVRGASALAFASPAVIACIVQGQGSFLFAALLAGTLLALDRRPWFAGACLGLLALKPQLGFLFPLILLAERRLAVFASATLVMLLLALLVAICFGWSSWQAFLGSVSGTAGIYFGADGAANQQSVFGVMSGLGAGFGLALILHAAIVAGALLLTLAVRRAGSTDAGAAALAALCGLASPYFFLHDAVLLTVAVAFLARRGAEAGFAPGEVALLVAALTLPGAPLLLGSLTAFNWAVPSAALLLLGLAARRARLDRLAQR
jgi:hypothetical protein